MRQLFAFLVLLGSTALAVPARLSAQSPTVTANGFAITLSVPVNAPPTAVYDALTTRVQQWWNPAHTFSGGKGTLSIDARPGGCFCEAFPGGGGVEHLRVVFVRPGSLLRLSGALGPMQGTGLAGALTFDIKPAEGGSKIDLSYVVGGYLPMGLDRIAPMAQLMLSEQVTRLKAFVETGSPETAKK